MKAKPFHPSRAEDVVRMHVVQNDDRGGKTRDPKTPTTRRFSAGIENRQLHDLPPPQQDALSAVASITSPSPSSAAACACGYNTTRNGSTACLLEWQPSTWKCDEVGCLGMRQRVARHGCPCVVMLGTLCTTTVSPTTAPRPHSAKISLVHCVFGPMIAKDVPSAEWPMEVTASL